MEYILLLAVAVGFVLLLNRSLLKPAFARLQQSLSKSLEDSLSKGIHKFPI